MKKLLAAVITAAAMSQPVQAAENDGYWYAENLATGCALMDRIASGGVPEKDLAELTPEDEMAMAMLASTCGAYIRGVGEVVASLGRYEVGGVCVATDALDVKAVVTQMAITAKERPELVAPREPSTPLILAAMSEAYPCR